MNLSETEIKNILIRAYGIATKSPDPSSQNGAILISSFGQVFACNEFPEGVTPRFDEKKLWTIAHSERNCIYTAAKFGISTKDSTLVCPWFACCDCAIAIIQSGIVRVIGHKQRMDLTDKTSKWYDSILHAHTMLKEAGVVMEFYDGFLDGPEILVSGQLWKP
jgi:dCMP deaminase